MKPKISIPIVLSLIPVVIFILIVSMSPMHPDKLLEGTWEEVNWNYEKVDGHLKHDSISQSFIEEVVKYKISKHLVIHQAERWTFKKGATLVLHKEGQEDVVVRWQLKGRGHILKLIYNDGKTTEYYQIKDLDKGKLTLHFENDVHARGIVKIEFTKKKN
jgi:hypothetical protein